MATKRGVRPDENLMMMQELDDRLKEQIDKLEHVRLAALDLKENLSAVYQWKYKSRAINSIKNVYQRLFFYYYRATVTRASLFLTIWSG